MTDSRISYINQTDHDKLRFIDFAKLKSGGRDEFSNKRLPVLLTLAPTVVAQVIAEFPDDNKSQATAIRWHLRGLEITRAIRKVKTDLEISANAISASARYEAEKKAHYESKEPCIGCEIGFCFNKDY